MQPTILVVDDEIRILDVIQAYLEKDGYHVLTAQDGETCLNIIKKTPVHLLILDLMLPEMSGEDVCKKVRTFSDIPIIMLTAKIEEQDKIQGLTIGADDYITKPFSTKELMARVRTLMRRAYRDSNTLADILYFNDDDLVIDIPKMKTLKKGSEVILTEYEFKILLVFLTNPGIVFTREQLVEKAFGIDYEGYDRTIDSHIKNIRHKIEDNPRDPKYILTVYGVGYKFGGAK